MCKCADRSPDWEQRRCGELGLQARWGVRLQTSCFPFLLTDSSLSLSDHLYTGTGPPYYFFPSANINFIHYEKCLVRCIKCIIITIIILFFSARCYHALSLDITCFPEDCHQLNILFLHQTVPGEVWLGPAQPHAAFTQAGPLPGLVVSQHVSSRSGPLSFHRRPNL